MELLAGDFAEHRHQGQMMNRNGNRNGNVNAGMKSILFDKDEVSLLMAEEEVGGGENRAAASDWQQQGRKRKQSGNGRKRMTLAFITSLPKFVVMLL